MYTHWPLPTQALEGSIEKTCENCSAAFLKFLAPNKLFPFM